MIRTAAGQYYLEHGILDQAAVKDWVNNRGADTWQVATLFTDLVLKNVRHANSAPQCGAWPSL